MIWSSFEIVQILLQEGARVSTNTLESLYSWRHTAEPAAQTTNLARLLMSCSDHLLIENPDEFCANIWGTPSTIAESVQILLSEVFPPYRSRPISERIQTIWNSGFWCDDTFFVWLGQDAIDGSCLSVTSQTDDQSQSLLARIARAVGLPFGGDIAKAVSQKAEIIGQTLKAGGVDAAYTCGESILFPYFRVQVFDSGEITEQVNFGVRAWLKVLVDAGADLERIAEGERRCFHTLQIQHYQRRWPEISSVSIVGLRTGHRVEDWQVYFSNPLDEWACDFWHLLEEGLEPLIPGSWIDAQDELAAQMRANPGRFKSLATSRRKRRRYLRLMGLTDDQARENLGPGWDHLLSINTLRRGDVLLTAPDLNWSYHGHWPQLGDPCGNDENDVQVWPGDNIIWDDYSIKEFFHKYCQ